MAIMGFKTRTILRLLSEDARISITDLAKNLQCSRITASKLLGEVVEKYSIKFTVEVDEDKIGLSQRHMLLIRLGKKPSPEELREIFANDPYVDCAFFCKGDFDLIIYALSNNAMDYIVWESLLPGKLADYGVQIYPSQIMLSNFGYLPINPQTMGVMMQNINNKDKELMELLSENSRMGVSELASRLKMSRTTIHYRLYTLVKNGFIKRYTISINKPPLDYAFVYATNYSFNKTSHHRSIQMMEYYKQYDAEVPLVNTFQFLAPMSGSFRFFGIGLFPNEATAINDAVRAHKRIFSEEKVKMRHSQIVEVIKGSSPFRNIDMLTNYKRFTWSKTAPTASSSTK